MKKQKFNIGDKVYQQGAFDIYECKIVEYIPNQDTLSSYGGRECGTPITVKCDCYKVEYEDGTTSIVDVGSLQKTRRGMYYI